MNPIRLACALVALAAMLPASAVAQDGTGQHTWKHPADWAQLSLRRWFVGLPPGLQYSEARYQLGDDPRWAASDWDDRSWRVMGFWDLPARRGIQWLRFRVRMDQGRGRLPAGVMITSVIAYEVFWDGVLVGSSGVPGMNRETEVPGRVDNWFSIPANLREPGEHVIAIRTSSYRCGFPAAHSGLRFLVDAPEVLQGNAVREAVGPTIAAGAMFMVGLASLIMWLLAARRPALLLLAGMGFCIAAMQSVHALRWLFQYPADWHHPALMVMTWLVAAQALCMVGFVVVHFELPGRWWLLGVLAVTFGLISWLSPERLNLEGAYILAAGVVASLGCVVWAAWNRRRDAWPAVVGISISAVLALVAAEDFRTNFFLKFLPAMLGLTGSMALHLHEERRRAQAAQLAAARLELEMLKKNIQPHFLLNTLATIMETIEQEPKTASALVESLAGEFRILSRVAGEKLIPLAQEIELCRAHLRVMSLRNDLTCSLIVEGVDERALVSPALFHTLVENGLTHLLPRQGRQDFVLRGEPTARGMRYTLLARERSAVARAEDVSNGPNRDGTGLRYIKARLEESFTGRWSLVGGPVAEGWQTVIELDVAPPASGGAERTDGAPALPRRTPA